MASADFCQVSYLATVPAYYLRRYFAILHGVYCIATAPAFPVKERVCQLFLWGSIVWALVFGLASVCAFWVFRFTAYALSLLCSSHLFDLSHPWASFLMNCHVTPTQWRRSSCRNCGDRQCVMKTCLLYTSPSPRDRQKSRMPSSA